MNDNQSIKIKDFRGLYYLNNKGEIKEAENENIEILLNYFQYVNKGEIKKNNRVSIFSSKQTYSINENIQIIHVFESLSEKNELYINGPKKIYNEYINGKLVTEISPTDIYPWIGIYDGETLASPGLDYGFDITNYVFTKKGKYIIQWNPGIYKSNKLEIIIE